MRSESCSFIWQPNVVTWKRFTAGKDRLVAVAAPGWYPDPENPGQQRYWDGSAWGERAPAATAAPPMPPLPPTPAPATGPGSPLPASPMAAAPRPPREGSPITNRVPIAIWAFVSLLLLIIGSVGPWIETSGGLVDLSVNGTDENRDGIVLIALAVLTVIPLGVWLALSQYVIARVIGLAFGLLFALTAAVIAVIDLDDVQSAGGGVIELSAGWGLWLCVFASLSLLLSLILAVAVRRFR
jgi:Protein of unknown function (DUF2510)